MYLLLLKYEIPKELFISEENLVACVQAIEEGYLDCPYHNKIHAADVIVTLYFFLSQGRLAEELDLVDIFAALFAAAIHDFAHPDNPGGVELRALLVFEGVASHR